MAANHAVATATNLMRAHAAWGADMPPWVRLLASACDASNQKAVADRLGKSGGYISRVLNHNYAGSYEEAETLVRAAYGNEDVVCPLWGAIPLASCIRARRRKSPARNQAHHRHDATCPTCPNNTDRREED
ncbi:MAG: hypothetical protein QOI38_2054 [Sphingomonadales bacterium]|jgi:hypothetical protein|nr:hypothetical protein [Sphingomonadales bacterium]